MRCPPFAILLFLLSLFQEFQRSSQYFDGPLYTPRTVRIGEFLNITCSGKQVFGSVSHNRHQITHEVAIMKLKEDLNNSNFYKVDPNFTFILQPLKTSGDKFWTVGDRNNKRFSVYFRGVIMENAGLRLYINMRCKDFGLYQCHMKLRNPNPPPETIYYHKNFYVDFIENIPLVKFYPRYSRYEEGKRMKIKCEHSTLEKKVFLAMVYRPAGHSSYYTMQGVDTKRKTTFFPYQNCGGNYVRVLIVTVLMDKELWNSEVICIANRPRVHVEELSQDLGHDEISPPLVLATCSLSAKGCVTRSISGEPHPGQEGTKPNGKMNTASYTTLLPVVVLIIVSFGVLAGGVLATKYERADESIQ